MCGAMRDGDRLNQCIDQVLEAMGWKVVHIHHDEWAQCGRHGKHIHTRPWSLHTCTPVCVLSFCLPVQ